MVTYPTQCEWCQQTVYKEVLGIFKEGGILCQCGYFYTEDNNMLRQEKKSDTILIPTGVSENNSSQR